MDCPPTFVSFRFSDCNFYRFFPYKDRLWCRPSPYDTNVISCIVNI